MCRTTRSAAEASLAYETHGDGIPVVFLHGLTFDRTTWRPIIERLGDNVLSIAFDLPAHGDTGGEPCTLREAAARVNSALESMGIDEPVMVGHSISAGIASIYAASYPVRGVVNVDGTVDIRQTAQLVRRLEPLLRSDRFAAAFEPFQQSMGLEHVPEPLRTQLLESQDIRRGVVLGYWEQLLRTDPSDLQAEIEVAMGRIDVPCLNVFGHNLPDYQRSYLREHVSGVWIEEWPDCGHFVHLAEPDRFAACLDAFIDHIDSTRARARRLRRWYDLERPRSSSPGSRRRHGRGNVRCCSASSQNDTSSAVQAAGSTSPLNKADSV